MKYCKRLLVLVLISFCSVSHIHAQENVSKIVGISIKRLATYENYVEREIDEGRIPGAVTLVTRKGKVAYYSALGQSSIRENTPMKMNNLFYIQSMTKPIITVAFLTLYEQGHFQLNDPVSRYLPEFEKMNVANDIEKGFAAGTVPAKNQMTISQLLSHTAGFTHGIAGTQLDKDIRKEMSSKQITTIRERVENIATLPLIGEPGEQWYYSSAPDLVSALIEHFSGMSTNEYLQKTIFDPLQMNDTGYNIPEEKKSRIVKLHNKNEEGVLVTTGYQPKSSGNTVWSGVNALFSTAQDYMTFCQMLLNKGELHGIRILGRKTVEMMLLDHANGLFQTPGEVFGYGFAVVNDLAKTEGLGSEGLFYWAGAYNTHFFIDPEEELVAIFMTQTASFDRYYHTKLRQMIYQAIVD